MKFILWTLVWWGGCLIEKLYYIYWFGGVEQYDEYNDKRYSANVRVLAYTVYVFCWIFLYIIFIK